MVTAEEIKNIFENKVSYKTRNIDHTFVAIKLLREKIPYDVCKSVIGSAEHDVVYLVDLNTAIPYLSLEDLEILADCNVCIECAVCIYEDSYFYLFV